MSKKLQVYYTKNRIFQESDWKFEFPSYNEFSEFGTCDCLDGTSAAYHNFCYSYTFLNNDYFEIDGERFSCGYLPTLRRLGLVELEYEPKLWDKTYVQMVGCVITCCGFTQDSNYYTVLLKPNRI